MAKDRDAVAQGFQELLEDLLGSREQRVVKQLEAELQQPIREAVVMAVNAWLDEHGPRPETATWTGINLKVTPHVAVLFNLACHSEFENHSGKTFDDMVRIWMAMTKDERAEIRKREIVMTAGTLDNVYEELSQYASEIAQRTSETEAGDENPEKNPL